jgi:hypothetical protein
MELNRGNYKTLIDNVIMRSKYPLLDFRDVDAELE